MNSSDPLPRQRRRVISSDEDDDDEPFHSKPPTHHTVQQTDACPPETRPETQVSSIESRPTQTQPRTETRPAETQPRTETRPAETQPRTETRPAETQLRTETRPAETQLRTEIRAAKSRATATRGVQEGVSSSKSQASHTVSTVQGERAKKAAVGRGERRAARSKLVEDDDDDDAPMLLPVKREAVASPKRANGAMKRKVKSEPRSPASTRAAAVKRKRPVLTEEHFEPINTWWDKELRSKDDPQWRYLEHSGIMFYPGYTPHKVPMIYDGQPIELPPQAEEVANFWCAAQTSEYPSKTKFIENFWAAFLSTFPSDHPFLSINHPVSDETGVRNGKKRKLEHAPLFEKACFNDIREFLEGVKLAEKEAKKNMTKEDREIDRIRRLQIEGPYMFAMHDYIREKVASYKAEVPGLFRGRGEHPKMGKLKRRIFPDEVCLNLSEDAPVPRLPPWLRGHSWQDVFHDNRVTWLAFYKDTVNNSFKYEFLAASSAVKGMKDFLKYELARKLKVTIGAIRSDYKSKMESSDLFEQQLGTATYVIDALALRVGNEKDREEEADTVGCCSLRKEHITAMNDETHEITLDFLGKDSIRYLNTVTLDALAYRNMKHFLKNKSDNQNLFETVSTGSLNRYLKDLMPGLSAKVFRTYNASVTLQQELKKCDSESDVDLANIEEAKRFYEYANRQVAILCNHQRSVPKQHDVSMCKLQKQLLWIGEDIQELQAYDDWLKRKSTSVRPNMKEDAVIRKLQQLEQKKTTLGLRIRVKDENKSVANHTSKQHYMDPRITVTFCKQHDLPIEKFFNASLLKKFPWAMYAKSDFVW